MLPLRVLCVLTLLVLSVTIDPKALLANAIAVYQVQEILGTPLQAPVVMVASSDAVFFKYCNFRSAAYTLTVNPKNSLKFKLDQLIPDANTQPLSACEKLFPAESKLLQALSQTASFGAQQDDLEFYAANGARVLKMVRNDGLIIPFVLGSEKTKSRGINEFSLFTVPQNEKNILQILTPRIVDPTKPPNFPVLGGSWFITQLGAWKGLKIEAYFDSPRVFINMCNVIQMEYSLQKQEVSFDKATSSKDPCTMANPSQIQLITAFIHDATRLVLNYNIMSIYDKDGTLIISMTKPVPANIPNQIQPPKVPLVPVPPVESPLSGAWQVVSALKKDLYSLNLYARFNASNLEYRGCNVFLSDYNFSAAGTSRFIFNIKGLVSTRMACMNDNLSAADLSVSSGLSGSRFFQVSAEGVTTFLDEKNNELLVLKKVLI